MVVGQLGALLMNWGRLEEARAALEEALEVFQATGHRYREGVMLTNLARHRDGPGPAGRRPRGRAPGAGADRGDRRRRGLSWPRCRAWATAIGWPATTTTARELPRARARGEPPAALPYFTAHLLASLAAVDLDDGRIEDAIAHAAEAQEAAATDDVPHAQARADLLAGMVRQDVGDPAAVDLLRAVAQKHAELGVEADWLESLSVLAARPARTPATSPARWRWSR